MSNNPHPHKLYIKLRVPKQRKRKRDEADAGNHRPPNACPTAATAPQAENRPNDMDVDAEDVLVGRSTSHEPLTVVKQYCCFCGDISPKMSVCNDCGAQMCEQVSQHGNGCIFLGTALPKEEFLCLLCDSKKWRNLPAGEKTRGLSFGFVGYSGRKRAKLTWPLVLVNLTLDTAAERMLSESLKLDSRFQYIAAPQNLEFVDVVMKPNGQNKATKATSLGISFVDRSIQSNVPANSFIVLDTHADAITGELQWSGGKTAPKTAPASNILDEFCGKPFLQEIRKAADAARSVVPPQSPGWYSDSPFLRGGWRGLFVASCGPAVRAPTAFRDLRRMVDEDKFDFVMAFAGSSTLSTHIKHAVSLAIETIGVDKTANLWDSLSRVVGRDVYLLHATSVLIIYRERGEGVRCRHIGIHAPPIRAWGVEFNACGNENCRPSPYDFVVRDNDCGVRVVCRLCNWTSTSVKLKDLRGQLFQLSSTVPDVFWHEYPPSVTLRDIFVATTKEKTSRS